MSKRFTDTEIWDKAWFMNLSMKHKLFIKFLFDKCDQAGIWEPNYTLAAVFVGDNLSSADLKELGDQVEILDNGKVFVPEFIDFQYGELSENCPPHRKIISLLKKYGLLERVTKGYCKGSNTLQEKEEEQEEEKEEEKDGDRGIRGKGNRFKKPSLDEVIEYFDLKKQEQGGSWEVEFQANKWYDHYKSNGWKIGGKSPMKDWKAAIRNWLKNMPQYSPQQEKRGVVDALHAYEQIKNPYDA